MDTPNREILALAVRARWFGFAVLDSRCRLIDWGMVFYQQCSTTEIRAAQRRLASLMTTFDPGLIAVAVSEVEASRTAPSVRALVKWLRTESRARSIPFQLVSRKFIRTAFHEFHAGSKDEIASAIVTLFPELRWKLPSRRKVWEKEHFRLALFDAVAVSVACGKHLSEAKASEDGTVALSGRPLGDV